MGPLLVILSAVCFGAMPIFGKFAYAEGVTPAELVFVRFVLAAVVLWGLVALRRRPAGPRRRAGRRVLLTAIGLGAIGYAAQASLFFHALEVMDASVLAIILYTFPAMVTLAAFALGRERPTMTKVLALGIALTGTMLVVLGSAALSFPVLGTVLGLGSAVTYTIYILVSDTIVGRMDPIRLAAIVMTSAAASLGIRELVTGGLVMTVTAMGWVWIGGIVVVSTVLAMTAFFAGLARSGPTTTAILSTVEPVATAALAFLVLGEVLTTAQLVGGLLVLTAVLLLQLRPRRSTGRRRPGTGPGSGADTGPDTGPGADVTPGQAADSSARSSSLTAAPPA